jgi:DMSO/TMAO reductase YedYZ molybdopterin-dependent catalytic subunit
MPEERKIVTAIPENSETPLSEVRSWVTPTRLFFVRNHFAEPKIDAASWRLRIDGLVDRPLDLSLDELRDMPQRSVLATMECAGNGRSFLDHTPGVQWGAGAIAHAEWSGAPLKNILASAGVKREATEVVFEGADSGSEPDHPEPMYFSRSLPLEKALSPDTLIALEMNGEPLTPTHGFPARLFVPGWYGVASVKWLVRIRCIEGPYRGYFQTKKYTVRRRIQSGEETVVLGRMAVKSEILRPKQNERLSLRPQRIFGAAWAGENEVARVEVSVDGGATWSDAELLGPHARYSWTLWEFDWTPSAAGRHVILARATSSAGEVQPERYDPLNLGYVINFSRPREVEVAAGRVAAPVLAPLAAEALLYDMNAFAEANAQAPLDVHLEYSAGGGI